MRRAILFFSVTFLIAIYSCNDNSGEAQAPPANVGTDSLNFTTVQWLDSAVNFGTVTKGEKVHVKYRCKNVGSKPMFIYYVRPGCGCTVADYTKAAIPPGGIGEVTAEFDSNHGVPGEVRKTITVQTNTFNASPHLSFYGTVKPNEQTPADSTKKSS